MKTLIGMTDFVLNENLNDTLDLDKDLADIHKDYANFLKQPLELWMFVPCDEDGNVLKEPNECDCNGYIEDCSGCINTYPGIEYQQAKERCLFEGFEVVKWDYAIGSYSIKKNNGTKEEIQVCYYKAKPDYFIWSFKTIEDLVKHNLTITSAAQKQL